MGDDLKRYHLVAMDFETTGLKILEHKSIRDAKGVHEIDFSEIIFYCHS